jgi:hypothetical protein
MSANATAAVVLTVALFGAGLPETTWAQEQARPTAVGRARPEPFLGVDVFAGGAAFSRYEQAPAGDDSDEIRYAATGWEAGATVAFGWRWLGITGAFGRQTIETVPVYQAVVGPRVTSPWMTGEDVGFRVFAHALVGAARTSGVIPAQSSTEWVLGGGIDIFLLRLQMDYVRLNLNGLRQDNYRVSMAGFVPLCLRACHASDGFNLSGRPAAR